MNRLIRLRYYNSRQRDIALGLLCGTVTTATAVYAWQGPTTLVTESPDTGQWRGKRVIANDPLASPRQDNTRIPTKKDNRLVGPTSKNPDTDRNLPLPSTRANVSNSGDDEDDSSIRFTGSGWFKDFDARTWRDKLATMMVPAWIRMVPAYVEKLQNELSGAPWSLSWEIWEDAHDPEINPEIIWPAQVRISDELCPAEQAFLDRRRARTVKALATYLDVPEKDIDPRDVPIIAMCGSGGGLRALVAGASSYRCAQQAGLYDCVTYTAGVSGSCWLQTLYYSSIGGQDYDRIINHLKQRLDVHVAYPPAALQLLNHAPTNKFLLSGFVEKLKGVPDADYGLVDAYGLMLAARLMVPKGELLVSDVDLKISNQRTYTDDGSHPLPIYTAVRHEVQSGTRAEDLMPSQYAWPQSAQRDWFQWFEWTPYEFFCEQLGCGIPTWAVGRKWNEGHSLWRENGLALPELRIPLMLGVWGSAFCASLSHYYKEIRPLLKASGLGGLDAMLHSGSEDDIGTRHPINPALIPNFALGLRHTLPSTVPESTHTATHLQLMDAGMSNNLPIYPLLRSGRNVDVIIAFDASADIKADNWLKVVDEYARERGIKAWPKGAGWPTVAAAAAANTTGAQQVAETAAVGTDARPLQGKQEEAKASHKDLSHCNIFIGSLEERPATAPTSSPLIDLTATSDPSSPLHSPTAGLAVIYFPLLASQALDPTKADFLSTWNFIYTPSQIDDVVRLARENFVDHGGAEATKDVVRAVWERKRRARLEAERREREEMRRLSMRRGPGAAAWRNGDVGQGDQFGGV